MIILAGVSGSGKTTVGQLLAQRLGWPFYDADDFHSAVAKRKMHEGVALTDADRWPWLQRLRELITECLEQGTDAILACSALKHAYRAQLIVDPAFVKLVHLQGSIDLITRRLAQRHGHFMPASLLRSQFDALEEPDEALVVDVSSPPEEIVAVIRQRLAV